MYFYRKDGAVLVSDKERKEAFLEPVGERQAEQEGDVLHYLFEASPEDVRRSFLLNHWDLAAPGGETLALLDAPKANAAPGWPQWVLKRAKAGLVKAVNAAHPRWTDCLLSDDRKSWRVHLVGLGDVGGTLLTGLRLLGGSLVETIGIYDPKPANRDRWFLEASQIYGPHGGKAFPEIERIDEASLFNCDAFVFCASRGVPPVGQEAGDVRMVQFKGNAAILSIYARMARERGFKGQFMVVSDPVDLLCRKAWEVSNRNEEGVWDHKGLATDQIRGYGLGVMHARARFYARQTPETSAYEREGGAFGPHGKGLVIANSLSAYDDALSSRLTDLARGANLKIRETGFKPFVAPALSSGALSILATLRGDWHHSAHFIGGVFMGSRNRRTLMGIEPERRALPGKLMERLEATYRELEALYE